MGKTTLFCLPYAGGSATVYFKWRSLLHQDIDLVPIELPGRGKRIGEPLKRQLSDMIEDIYNSICVHVSNHPEAKENYAIFGYSMGSLLGYELYFKLVQEGFPAPRHLFFAAREAPHRIRQEPWIHVLSNEELCNKLISLGGTTQAFFESKDMMELFLPIIRADYQVIETFTYVVKTDPIRCDLSILTAVDDPDLKEKGVLEWRMHTIRTCKFYAFQGGHFFLNEHSEQIIAIIHEALLEAKGKRGHSYVGTV